MIDHPFVAGLASGASLNILFRGTKAYLEYATHQPFPVDEDLLNLWIPLISLFPFHWSYVYFNSLKECKKLGLNFFEKKGGRRKKDKQKKFSLKKDLEMIIGDLKNKKYKEAGKSIWDFPYNHPLIVPSLIALTNEASRELIKIDTFQVYAAAVYLKRGRGIDEFLENMNFHHNDQYLRDLFHANAFGIFNASIFFLSYFGIIKLLDFLVRSKNIRRTATLKDGLLYRLGFKREAIQKLEDYFKKDPEFIWGELCEIYVKEQQYEKALQIQKSVLPLAANNSLFKGWVKTVTQPIYIANRQKRISEKNPLMINFINLGISLNQVNEREKARAVILDGVQKCYAPDKFIEIESRMLSAYALDSMGYPKDAQQQWQEAILLIRQHPELAKSFERVENYDVFHLGKGRLLENEVILKGGVPQPAALQKEFDLSQKLLERTRGSEFGSVEPILVFDVAGGYYLAERHAPGERLSDYVARTGDLTAMRTAARHLAFIHSVMEPSLVGNHYDPRTHLEARLTQLDPEVAQKICDSVQFIFRNYDKYPQVFHKDGHNENFFRSDNGRSVSLDVEDKGRVYPQEDAAKLFGIGNNFPRSPEGFTEMECSIQEDYAQVFNRSEHHRFDPSDFTREVQLAILSKSLTYFCFAQNKPKKRERARDSLRNAVSMIDFCQDEPRSGQFSKQIHDNLSTLKRAYQTLLTT